LFQNDGLPLGQGLYTAKPILKSKNCEERLM